MAELKLLAVTASGLCCCGGIGGGASGGGPTGGTQCLLSNILSPCQYILHGWDLSETYCWYVMGLPGELAGRDGD